MNATRSFTHNTFGDRIREERTKRGWTMIMVVDEMLALHYNRCTAGNRNLALSTETIKRWETGNNTPIRYYRDLLSEVFQVSRKDIDDLIANDFVTKNSKRF